MHIVVVNPDSGEVEQAKIFDTFKTSEKFDAFIKNSDNVPYGHIIVAACKDECTKNLSTYAK